MKYSYNWLKEISKTKLSPEKMADLLMMHSFEVEGIENSDGDSRFEKVVVGKILEINKHPNADRLQLTKVDIGEKKLDIVCGASNIKTGDKVPVALVGAKLPSGMEIKEAEIRGVKSFGMLCAEDELGLGKSHEGILILKNNAKIGEKINKFLDIEDTVFEIKVLPDRSHDALSHFGMAQEVAVLNGKKISHKIKKISPKKSGILNVKVNDKNLCSRYMAAVIKNIKVQDSPDWMKNRLSSLGIKPINNIVDATNYVMLELGQPLHAFDLEKISNNFSISTNQFSNKSQKSNIKIIVRKAKDKEVINLLDGTKKELSSEDLVIANEEKALAIAGVMGGEESGIGNKTSAIVIESANFDAVSIRKTRTRLNVKTEASDRYEKEIDPNLCELSLARVVQIIESFGGETEEVVDFYPNPVKEWKIKLDLEYANNLLGEKIPLQKAIKILNLLGLETFGKGKSTIVKIPTVRIDLKTQEDLIEEIGRIYGYEKIESVAPLFPVEPSKSSESRKFERLVKDYLVGVGFSEVYNYSFYGQDDVSKTGLEKEEHLELKNPMNPNQKFMRRSLVPGLLNNIRENLKNFKEMEIFEIDRVYFPKENNLPEEKNILTGAIVAEEKGKGNNFYEIKGYLDLMLKRIGLRGYYFDEFRNSKEKIPFFWHKTRSAEIKTERGEELLGYAGEINPSVLHRFGIEKRAAMFEIDLSRVEKISQENREFEPLSKFPTISRDISLISDPEVIADDILKVIQNSGGNMILDVELFDIFDLSEGKTSFTFHIIFGAKDRTLTNDEVDEMMKKIIFDLEKELKIEVRK